MSESDLAEAVREQVAAMKQASAVNAASIAQRSNEMVSEHARRDAANAYNYAMNRANLKTHAVSNALKNKNDRPVEEVLADAAKIYDWLVSTLPDSDRGSDQ